MAEGAERENTRGLGAEQGVGEAVGATPALGDAAATGAREATARRRRHRRSDHHHSQSRSGAHPLRKSVFYVHNVSTTQQITEDLRRFGAEVRNYFDKAVTHLVVSKRDYDAYRSLRASASTSGGGGGMTPGSAAGTPASNAPSPAVFPGGLATGADAISSGPAVRRGMGGSRGERLVTGLATSQQSSILQQAFQFKCKCVTMSRLLRQLEELRRSRSKPDQAPAAAAAAPTIHPRDIQTFSHAFVKCEDLSGRYRPIARQYPPSAQDGATTFPRLAFGSAPGTCPFVRPGVAQEQPAKPAAPKRGGGGKQAAAPAGAGAGKGKKPAVAGLCECCGLRYEGGLDRHCLTKTHLAFAHNDDNYGQVDTYVRAGLSIHNLLQLRLDAAAAQAAAAAAHVPPAAPLSPLDAAAVVDGEAETVHPGLAHADAHGATARDDLAATPPPPLSPPPPPTATAVGAEKEAGSEPVPSPPPSSPCVRSGKRRMRATSSPATPASQRRLIQPPRGQAHAAPLPYDVLCEPETPSPAKHTAAATTTVEVEVVIETVIPALVAAPVAAPQLLSSPQSGPTLRARTMASPWPEPDAPQERVHSDVEPCVKGDPAVASSPASASSASVANVPSMGSSPTKSAHFGSSGDGHTESPDSDVLMDLASPSPVAALIISPRPPPPPAPPPALEQQQARRARPAPRHSSRSAVPLPMLMAMAEAPPPPAMPRRSPRSRQASARPAESPAPDVPPVLQAAVRRSPRKGKRPAVAVPKAKPRWTPKLLAVPKSRVTEESQGEEDGAAPAPPAAPPPPRCRRRRSSKVRGGRKKAPATTARWRPTVRAGASTRVEMTKDKPGGEGEQSSRSEETPPAQPQQKRVGRSKKRKAVPVAVAKAVPSMESSRWEESSALEYSSPTQPRESTRLSRRRKAPSTPTAVETASVTEEASSRGEESTALEETSPPQLHRTRSSSKSRPPPAAPSPLEEESSALEESSPIAPPPSQPRARRSRKRKGAPAGASAEAVPAGESSRGEESSPATQPRVLAEPETASTERGSRSHALCTPAHTEEPAPSPRAMRAAAKRSRELFASIAPEDGGVHWPEALSHPAEARETAPSRGSTPPAQRKASSPAPAPAFATPIAASTRLRAGPTPTPSASVVRKRRRVAVPSAPRMRRLDASAAASALTPSPAPAPLAIPTTNDQAAVTTAAEAEQEAEVKAEEGKEPGAGFVFGLPSFPKSAKARRALAAGLKSPPSEAAASPAVTPAAPSLLLRLSSAGSRASPAPSDSSRRGSNPRIRMATPKPAAAAPAPALPAFGGDPDSASLDGTQAEDLFAFVASPDKLPPPKKHLRTRVTTFACTPVPSGDGAPKVASRPRASSKSSNKRRRTSKPTASGF